MSKGIVIFGPAGAGKTTLAMMVASYLEFPCFDYDDYIWKNDAGEPFTVRYPEEEKVRHLLNMILANEYYVLSGYMNGSYEVLDRTFILAVHVNAPAGVRMERIRKRDESLYGKRVLPGGDMYKTHERFLETAASYSEGSASFFGQHKAWAESLGCPVLYLDSTEPMIDNAEKIIEAYRGLTG